jgi:RNA polymerase sigma-70 factor (ECF subfamily)
MDRSSPVKTDDDQFIARATRGDREAFGRLYEQHAVRVFRHAYFLTGDVTLSEDLTAQTFLKALEAIPRYQSRGVPFIAWLLRITCNLSINYRKAHKNNGHAQLPDTLEAEAAFCSPERSCEIKADGEFVWQEVRKLSCEQRQVIVMRFIDDLGYPDIAHVLGKTVGAVRVIQFRALANLRHLMACDAELPRSLARAS